MDLSQTRKSAREALNGNWNKAAILVVVCFITSWICNMIPFFGIILGTAVSFVLALTFVRVLVSFLGGHPMRVEDLFRDIDAKLLSWALAKLISTFASIVGTFLLVIPGIYFHLRFYFVDVLGAKFPEKSTQELLDESARLTEGRKMEMFFNELVFIGWSILSVFTLGIGLVYVNSYYQVTKIKMYESFALEVTPAL